MSSVNTNEAYKWAKAKQAGANFNTGNSKRTDPDDLAEELVFWKKKLLESPEKKEQYLTHLLDLRAKQTMNEIHDLQIDAHPQVDKKINQAVAAYYADCMRLIAAANRLYHGRGTAQN